MENQSAQILCGIVSIISFLITFLIIFFNFQEKPKKR
ncbi:hypothetical protein RS022_05680 [Candidatus Phytoplasma rubi]|uniref:Uncharacterized protein n=1 Tax=Candidatus Phytoplasma rubi TaxID=399025 RepID=A0ABY7BS00_9MOLU|nr:hypothetical protein RS022_01520 [Candidatus Phytoplasma rubi]WAN63429.1 hypothetical protein RS022_05680 [Candidatus Phytoplasma rubi]